MSDVPVTAQLAGFAATLQWRDVPREVRELMPVLLIDVFRAGALGYDKPWTRSVRELCTSGVSGGQSSVWFSEAKLDPARAAFANGVASGSLDWDDAHVAAILHPGIVVWPAALAVAQSVGASGEALLAAAVAGYEVAIRVGMSVQPELSLRGFQGTPTCGVFGAAAAAARLLGLDATRTRDALGIASTFACGLAQFFVSGSDIKRIHAGKAAANGVEAALLAAAGLTGPHDAIEGVQGFANGYSSRFDPAIAVQGLGIDFPTRAVSLKPHAGSVRMQAAIEAAIALALEGVAIDAVDAIEIGVHRAMIGKLTGNAPADHQQAQLSTPFAVAMALSLAPARGPECTLSIDDFEACLGDERIRALSMRATCVTDAQVERLTTQEVVPGRVTLVLKDGTKRQKFVEHPKGSPRNPMTREAVAARFRAVASGRVAAGAIEDWLGSAARVDALPDVSSLLGLRAVSK